MKKIEITSTQNLPKIIFDGDNGYFEITGNSYPQDAESFYVPLINYANDYLKKARPITNLTCEIEYFQTTSQKFLTDIIKTLSLVNKQGLQLNVNWKYHDEEDNEDIIISGKELEIVLNIKFNFIKK